MRWAAVGIASLRDEQLSKLPEELWSIGPSIRVADFGGNKLMSIPASLTAFSALQRLRLSHNQLSDDGIPWPALAVMPQLAVLALDHNRSAEHMMQGSTGHYQVTAWHTATLSAFVVLTSHTVQSASAL